MIFKHFLQRKRIVFMFLVTFLSLKNTFAQGHEEGYGAGAYKVDSANYVNYCEGLPVQQYYSLHCKHPLSSQQLLAEVRNFYKKPDNNAQNGFLTVRFVVSCKGQICCMKTYEIDENYQTRSFDKAITDQLKSFVRQLGGWKLGEYEGKPYNYYYYFTFKIQNGEIQNIAP